MVLCYLYDFKLVFPITQKRSYLGILPTGKAQVQDGLQHILVLKKEQPVGIVRLAWNWQPCNHCVLNRMMYYLLHIS